MGFEFRERKPIEICGKQYDVDVTDTGFINGVVTSFPAILSKYQAFAQLQKDVSEKILGGVDDSEIESLSQRLKEENEALGRHAADFIISVLGAESYDEIFASRKRNTVEHIELCTYIYSEVVGQREELISKYIDLPGGDTDADHADHSQTEGQ